MKADHIIIAGLVAIIAQMIAMDTIPGGEVIGTFALGFFVGWIFVALMEHRQLKN